MHTNYTLSFPFYTSYNYIFYHVFNLKYLYLLYIAIFQTTLQALERSQRENNVLSERLGAVSLPFSDLMLSHLLTNHYALLNGFLTNLIKIMRNIYRT